MKQKNWKPAVIVFFLSAVIGVGSIGCGGSGATPPPPANPIAAITALTPSAIAAHGTGFTLTVKGTGFVSGSVVQWNGHGRTTTFVDSTQLNAQIVPGDIALAGRAGVTVSNPSPGGSSSPVNFSVLSPRITFTSNQATDGSNISIFDTNVWVVNADGAGAVALTRQTSVDMLSYSPTWSPDGGKIAFESNRALDGSDSAMRDSNIWVISADGSGAAPLTKQTAIDAFSSYPAWSPDSSKIAFESNRALDGSDSAMRASNIWVMSADGSGAAPLTKQTTIDPRSLLPTWSPDGSKIAFLSNRAPDGSDSTNSVLNIWLMNADGSGAAPLTRLTSLYPFIGTPVWSPDGSKIAFASNRALNGSDAVSPTEVNNIWVMNANGSGATPLTKLTNPSADCDSPVWAPDGSKVAFVSARVLDGSDATGTVSNLWVMNADGSGATALTRTTASFASARLPQWSPDGTRITYLSRRALDGSDAENTNASWNIWVVNADGSSATPVTRITGPYIFIIDPLAWQP